MVCQNCTLIFSRTRKQNWIIICQCCLRIWRTGRWWGLEVLKCFVRGCQNFFYLLCVCVCLGKGGGGGGQVQYLSFREKDNRPPPINKWLVPITKCPMGHYVAYLFLRYFLYSVITGWSQQNALVKSSIGALWPRRPILLWQPLMLVHILGFMTFRPSVI